MSIINIVIESKGATPCPTNHNNTHERWIARFADTKEQIGETYLNPFTGAARALIEMGYDPEDMLTLVYDDQPGWKIRAKLGIAAKLTVSETTKGEAPARLAKWRPNTFFDKKENPA